jgi:hypothetical protein
MAKRPALEALEGRCGPQSLRKPFPDSGKNSRHAQPDEAGEPSSATDPGARENCSRASTRSLWRAAYLRTSFFFGTRELLAHQARIVLKGRVLSDAEYTSWRPSSGRRQAIRPLCPSRILPGTTLDLSPGRHRLEVRKSSQAAYLTYATVQTGEVRRLATFHTTQTRRLAREMAPEIWTAKRVEGAAEGSRTCSFDPTDRASARARGIALSG